MNLEDIKKQAKIAEQWLELGAFYTDQLPFPKALIAAARLLEQVEVVRSDEVKQMGDLLEVKYGERGEFTDYIKCKNDGGLPAVTLSTRVIMRNNKPAIYLPKEIAE